MIVEGGALDAPLPTKPKSYSYWLRCARVTSN